MKRLALSPLAFGSALLCAGAAVAQFGGPFDAPRPPGSVPVQPQPQQAPPQSQPPPQWQAPAQQAVTPAARPGIQSEDLPPPGSGRGAVQPAALPPGPGQTGPGQNRQPPAGQPPPPGPAAVPAPPPAEVVTAPPARRITNPTAAFNGLDKITGRITTFESAIGETVQFGALQVTVRACYSRPPTETPLTDGFVEVDEVTLQGDIRRIFTGWMFAASPGLHGVEHAVYDVWLVDCKGGAQVAADAQPTTPAAAPSRQQPPQQRQQGQGTTQPRQPRAPPPGAGPARSP